MNIGTDDWIHFEETDMPFLAAFLCTNRKNLFDLVNRADNHYRRLELRKKSGGVRVLHVPDDELKVIQPRHRLYPILRRHGLLEGAVCSSDRAGEHMVP